MEELFKDKYRTAYKRMFEIDRLIRSEKCPSAAKIAERLGVSKRTIQRDLRYMESALGAPIAYSDEERGYFYLYPGFSLSDFSYTDTDVAVLSLAWRIMEALFGGTFYSSALGKTLSSILRHAGNMPQMLFHTVRENVQIALPNWGSFSEAEAFIQAMNKQLCVHCIKDDSFEAFFRPIRLIYAWDNWYLLYIMEDYADNSDFYIDKLEHFSKIRTAGRAESLRIKDIVGTLSEYPAPMTGGKNTRVEYTKEYGNVLYVDIRGIGDEFHLAYRRLADGELKFIRNERTMLGGHLMETLLSDDKDTKIDI